MANGRYQIWFSTLTKRWHVQDNGKTIRSFPTVEWGEAKEWVRGLEGGAA
jgi:hypothetical protein